MRVRASERKSENQVGVVEELVAHSVWSVDKSCQHMNKRQLPGQTRERQAESESSLGAEITDLVRRFLYVGCHEQFVPQSNAGGGFPGHGRGTE